MKQIELGTILHMEKGKKPKLQSKDAIKGYLPYVDIKAFEQGIIDNYASTEKVLLCEDGDLLIVGDGSRSGLTGRAIKGIVGSTLYKIYADGMTTDYLRYFIESKYLLLNTQKKGTGTPHLNANILKKSKLIVPSIEEQERIVAKIEELFSDLDNAVETLKATKAQLKLYKQAVLKSAFDGKLTNNGNPEIKELASFIEQPRYGTSKKCNYQDDIEAYTEVYRIPNIDASTGTLDKSDLKYAQFNEDEIEKLSLKYGDILIVRSNGSPAIVGTAAMVREQDVSGLFAGYLIRVRVSDDEKLSPKYLLRYLSSYDARRYIENVSKSTSGVNNVNAQEIKKIKIPYFKKEIQDQIIYEIDSRLSAYENIEQTVNDALQQATAMRQSILKQAFEGRLI